MKKTTKVLMLLTLCASLAFPGTAQAATKIKKVKWKAKTITVTKGQKVNLKKHVKLTPSKAKITTKNVSWKSSKKSVATISKKGVLKAKKTGTTIVTLKVKGGKSYKVRVRVKNAVKKITTPKNGVVLNGYGAVDLSKVFTFSPSNVNMEDLKWSSSNPSVATVNDKGMVTPKKNGTTTISVKSTTGSKVSASAKITVTGAETYEETEEDDSTSDRNASSGGNNSGSGNSGTTTIGEVKFAAIVYDMNVPAGASLVTSVGSNDAKQPGVGVPYTFKLPTIDPVVNGYTFQGYSTSKNGSIQYNTGGSISVKGGETVTLYAQWKKKEVQKINNMLIVGDLSGVDGATRGYGVYFADEAMMTPLTHFTYNGVDYIYRSKASTGQDFGSSSVSSITGINITDTAQKIADAIGNTAFTGIYVSKLENRLINFYVETAGNPYTDRLGLYNSATEFVNGEYSLDKCTGKFRVGSSTLSKTDERKAMLIWAQAVDSWKTTYNGKTIGFWDYAMYKNTNFVYDLRPANAGLKGIAQGIKYSGSGPGDALISGSMTVYKYN